MEVLPTVPGYLAAVWVGTGSVAPVQLWNREGTELPDDERFQTGTVTITAVF